MNHYFIACNEGFIIPFLKTSTSCFFFSGTHFGVVCNKMFRRTFDFRFQSIFIHFALMLSFPLILPKIPSLVCSHILPSPLLPSLSLDLSSFSLYLFSVRFEISLLSQSISPYQNLMVTLHAFDSLGNWTLRKTHSHTHTYTHSPLQMFTANILSGNDGIAMKIACCGRNDEMSLERRERKNTKRIISTNFICSRFCFVYGYSSTRSL